MPDAATLTDSDRVGQSVCAARKVNNPNENFQLHFWSCLDDERVVRSENQNIALHGTNIRVSIYERP